MMRKIMRVIIPVFIIAGLLGIAILVYSRFSDKNTDVRNTIDWLSEDILPYKEEPYIAIHKNQPYFTEEEISGNSFKTFKELDALGRCGTTFSCIGPEMLPTEERREIGSIRPSGWHTVKYDCIPDRYLYNRCHLLAYCLSGENANVQNLITGTRYLNMSGMLPFEIKVAEYVESTGNHVMYRVTPHFEEKELVARGVLMEAYSVEDKGAGICFCVYCYNVQPGIYIDYATGDSYELTD